MPDIKNLLSKAKGGFNKAKDIALDGLDKAKDKAIDGLENIDKEKVLKNTEKVLLYSGEATLHIGGTVSKLVSCSLALGSSCEDISAGEQEACRCFSEITYNLSEGLHGAGKALSNVRKRLDENSNSEISYLECSDENENIENNSYDENYNDYDDCDYDDDCDY